MENEEIWKDIPGYEGKYQASSLGRIRSLDRFITKTHPRSLKKFKVSKKGQILKPGPVKTGHLYVVLGHHTPGIPVHQLIAKTFIGDRPEGHDIRHLNGDPSDNKVENLTYGSRTDNILDVYKQGKRWRKLSIEDVKAIRERIARGEVQKEIAKCFKVSAQIISSIKHKRIYWWLQ